MSILKEPKSLDDRSIKEDTPYEKWADRFPTGQYRTFSTHVPMFDFTTKTSPTLQWEVKDFSKWFKNPAGLPIASNETVPLTHYKLSSNDPAKVDKDVFGNNIINNQKDFTADYMNRTLPEKYAYGLDRKGQGDLAYEQLDIEEGDENELSRAREEFFEQMYLQENNPEVLRDLTRAKGVVASFPKTPTAEVAKAKVQDARDAKAYIEVEAIPHLLGKTPTPISDETSQAIYSSLLQQKNRPLTVFEVNRINDILTQLNAKKIPYNTLAHNGANKLKQAYMSKKESDPIDDDEVERKYQKKEARRRKAKEEQSAGGGGFSESKRSEEKPK